MVMRRSLVSYVFIALPLLSSVHFSPPCSAHTSIQTRQYKHVNTNTSIQTRSPNTCSRQAPGTQPRCSRLCRSAAYRQTPSKSQLQQQHGSTRARCCAKERTCMHGLRAVDRGARQGAGGHAVHAAAVVFPVDKSSATVIRPLVKVCDHLRREKGT